MSGWIGRRWMFDQANKSPIQFAYIRNYCPDPGFLVSWQADLEATEMQGSVIIPDTGKLQDASCVAVPASQTTAPVVLLVENVSLARAALATALENAGLEVIQTDQADAAFDTLRRFTKISAVVTDLS